MDLADLKQRVGRRLGIVPSAGSLSAEDGELVGAAYTSLYSELARNDLAMWTPDVVPDEFADIIVGMTSARLVDEFTVPEPRRSQLIMQSGFGLPAVSLDERRLRKLVAVPVMDEPTAEYL